MVIYNRVITASEVSFLYQGTSGGSTIYTDARLGIGMSNPQYALDVTGGARVSGFTYLGSSFGLKMYLVSGTLPAANGSTTSGVTMDKIVSISGVAYNGSSWVVPIAYSNGSSTQTSSDLTLDTRMYATPSGIIIVVLGGSTAIQNLPFKLTVTVTE